MRINKVTPAKQHLYDVQFEDGQSIPIDKTIWEHSGLSVGADVTQEEQEALYGESLAFRAREKALYYLSNRDYGSGELIQKLCRAGTDRTVAEQTVMRLRESGLIDDERYATTLARDLQERKLYPKRRIAMALREKGFSSEIVSLAVDSLSDEEEEQALSLLHKKRIFMIEDPKQREKVLAMLSRYGFSYAVASRALSRLNDME